MVKKPENRIALMDAMKDKWFKRNVKNEYKDKKRNEFDVNLNFCENLMANKGMTM